ncbi:hypothetical protein A7A78_01870 [Aequorivita soesokkakensis]|uniref:Uncharacterized protein n=1 Tax=Aequorivita soesokkakensis TaxID=1385699 RepID=A0A1A9LIY2_9FLAO|nr:DUF6263 family protein [Aequorivita soesokkakensis]OAD92681.1 hypothetical protein A7A78_01870 [Aequorivita soesokkakensis]
MKSVIYLILFLNILGLQTITAQEKLQYNLKKDDVFRIEQNAVQNIVQKMDSIEHQMTNTIGGIFLMKVVNIIDGKYVFEVNFEKFKFKTESDIYGILSDVDTDVPPADEEDIMAKVFQGLIGPKFRMVMLKTGQIESLTGTENLIENMIKQVEMGDEATNSLIKETFEKEFNNQDMLESLQQFTFIYPEVKVKVNQTWTNNYTGPVNAENTWKLVSYSKDDAIVLSANSTVVMETKDDSVIMKLTGNQQTEATSSASSGFIKTMEVNQETEGATIVPEIDNNEIPTSLTSKITYKLL